MYIFYCQPSFLNHKRSPLRLFQIMMRNHSELVLKLLAADECSLGAPNGVVALHSELLGSIGHDLLGDQLLHCALNWDVLALGSSEVAAHGLPESLCLVFARSMNQQGMEKDDVALLHVQVDSVVLEFLIIFDAEVGLVHLSVPVRVVMVVESALVCLGKNIQATVLVVAILQGSPSSHDTIGRPEGEVGQVLMEGVSGAGAHAWRLIDEHSMDRFDVLSAEALEVGNEVWIGAVGLQDIIPLKILDLRDICLSRQFEFLVLLGQRDITHNLHAGQSALGVNYVGIFQSQQSRNLWRQASISSSLRSFLTKMQPFCSQNLRCSRVRQPLSVVQRKFSAPPRSELSFERRSIMTQYLYNTRLGTLILMDTGSTSHTGSYGTERNVKPFSLRENHSPSLIFRKVEEVEKWRFYIIQWLYWEFTLKRQISPYSQVSSYLVPSEIRASIITIHLANTGYKTSSVLSIFLERYAVELEFNQRFKLVKLEGRLPLLHYLPIMNLDEYIICPLILNLARFPVIYGHLSLLHDTLVLGLSRQGRLESALLELLTCVYHLVLLDELSHLRLPGLGRSTFCCIVQSCCQTPDISGCADCELRAGDAWVRIWVMARWKRQSLCPFEGSASCEDQWASLFLAIIQPALIFPSQTCGQPPPLSGHQLFGQNSQELAICSPSSLIVQA